MLTGATVRQTVCPCCGRPVVTPMAMTSLGAAIQLSNHERRIFNRLARSPGAWVSPAQLVDAVFSDEEDGGPERAVSSVSSAVKTLRRKLATTGLKIETSFGRGNGERRLVSSGVKQTLTTRGVGKDSLTSEARTQ